MEKERKASKHIRNKILLFTLSCILGMCLLVGLASFFIYRNYLQDSLIRSTETSLKLLSNSIDSKMDDVYRLVRYLQSDSSIYEYIENSPEPGSVLSVKTYDKFSEECARNASYAYMPRIAVIAEDNFLQVVATTYSSTADIAALLPSLSFYETLLNDSDYNYSPGFISDPFHRTGRSVLPIIRPIAYQYNSSLAGYLFIEVSDELFTSAFKEYSISEDSTVYLTIAEHTYEYSSGSLTEVTPSYTVKDDLSKLSLSGETLVYEITDKENKSHIFVSTPMAMKGCYLSQSISDKEQSSQNVLFLGILAAILIGIIAIGTLLFVSMNRMITTPVTRLNERMLKIADGDFSRDPDIEWNHELGDVGRGINNLSENVNQLMQRRLEDEKQKQDLEYKMLQSQINPHFLYNTLNSIKWMATIQGAEGISEMTTALSRLLKSISKGTSLIIDIREELSLLDNYFTIQKYRYGGTVNMNVHVADEALYDCEIIKFTLQPLVENSIFHGIEPKGTAGNIDITVDYESKDDKENIRIDVCDDGIGMSDEVKNSILLTNENSSADFFKEIGISNVQKRIQFEFGTSYGITIDSKIGEYTKMSIHLPNIKKEKEQCTNS